MVKKNYADIPPTALALGQDVLEYAINSATDTSHSRVDEESRLDGQYLQGLDAETQDLVKDILGNKNKSVGFRYGNKILGSKAAYNVLLKKLEGMKNAETHNLTGYETLTKAAEIISGKLSKAKGNKIFSGISISVGMATFIMRLPLGMSYLTFLRGASLILSTVKACLGLSLDMEYEIKQQIRDTGEIGKPIDKLTLDEVGKKDVKRANRLALDALLNPEKKGNFEQYGKEGSNKLSIKEAIAEIREGLQALERVEKPDSEVKNIKEDMQLALKMLKTQRNRRVIEKVAKVALAIIGTIFTIVGIAGAMAACVAAVGVPAIIIAVLSTIGATASTVITIMGNYKLTKELIKDYRASTLQRGNLILTKDIPMDDMPTDDNLTEDVPMKDAQVEDVSKKDISIKDMPIDDTPSEMSSKFCSS
jgi:hypothetical protein